MSKYQRTKGKKGELDVVHRWRSVFPSAHRHLEFQSAEAERGIDVILDKHHGIQVKVGNQVPKKIYDFIEQIQSRPGELNWVECKRDRKDWLVILEADDFRKIVARLTKK